MIRYLKRNEIDIEKYDSCIENSFNSRIYAYSWYLDIVADNWDVLVLDDYEAVMPLPWRQKYFIKYIYPPAWTQQLGVFAIRETSEELILKFIKAIPRRFKKITIQFNSENKFQQKNLTERVNYVFPLNKSYEETFRGYNSNRKRDLKKAKKNNYTVEENIDINLFFEFYKGIDKNYLVSKNQTDTLKNLLLTKETKIIGVFKNDNLAATLLYFIDSKRITYLLPVAATEAKELGLPTLLINYLIEKHQESSLIFDFEGSMIEGVADFYKSFGGKLEYYSNFKITNIGK